MTTERKWRAMAEGVAAEFQAHVDWTRRGHPRVTLPNGRRIAIPRTPSHPEQMVENIRTRLRRKA